MCATEKFVRESLTGSNPKTKGIFTPFFDEKIPCSQCEIQFHILHLNENQLWYCPNCYISHFCTTKGNDHNLIILRNNEIIFTNTTPVEKVLRTNSSVTEKIEPVLLDSEGLLPTESV